MYNVITPAGNLKVETLTEALEYRNLYGYPYRPIVSAVESGPEYLNDDELDTDAMGNCYSDADPGL